MDGRIEELTRNQSMDEAREQSKYSVFCSPENNKKPSGSAKGSRKVIKIFENCCLMAWGKERSQQLRRKRRIT